MTHQQSTLTPYSPVLVETLQNLIAPGNCARLSPYVEAAQFEVLFGKRLSPEKRHKQAIKILEDRKEDIEALAQTLVDFRSHKKFSPESYDRQFLRCYLAYYFTVNVCKIQLTLLELVRHKMLSGATTILDLGVGTGTTAVGALDFFIAWAHVCALYGVKFPLDKVEFIGLDANEQCLEFAGKVVQAYSNALATRSASILTDESAWNILKKAEDMGCPDTMETVRY